MKDLLKVKVKVKKGTLRITIGKEALAFAAQNNPEHFPNKVWVVDEAELLNKVCNYLNNEDPEDGITPMQRLLDEVIEQLIDNGEGFIIV